MGFVMQAGLPATVFANAWNASENEYHVNPLIFLTLYLVSFVPFYVGVYLVLSGGKRRSPSRILTGVLVNRLAWGLPYVYVLAFGRNLPVWVAALVITWPLVTLGWLALKRDDPSYLARWERRLARVVDIGRRVSGGRGIS